MNKTLANVNVGEAEVEIVTYNEGWPAMFETERALLQAVLSVWLTGDIEHIGSTAVPELVAKPIIDIMAPVADLTTSVEAIEAVKNLGYVYYPYKSAVMHWFCKPSPHFRTHHLHIVPHDSLLWKERLIFRDALRHNQKLFAEYAALKLHLSHLFRRDRDAYTAAKEPFIARVLLQFSEPDDWQPHKTTYLEVRLHHNSNNRFRSISYLAAEQKLQSMCIRQFTLKQGISRTQSG